MKNRWEILEELINKNNYRIIAEIGVSKGLTADYLLRKCKIDSYYMIDPDPNEVFERTIPKFYTNAYFIRTTSKEAVDIIKEPLDLIFIDADHGYGSVKEDILLWLPKIRKGGIICGHDYIDLPNRVKKAVDELFVDFHLEDDILEDGKIKVWWKYV